VSTFFALILALLSLLISAQVQADESSDLVADLVAFAESLSKGDVIYLNDRTTKGQFVGKKMRVFMGDPAISDEQAFRMLISDQVSFSDMDIPNFGVTKNKVWGMFVVLNDTEQDVEKYLEFDYPFAPDISLYRVHRDQGLMSKHVGTAVNFAQRDLKARTFVFKETMRPGLNIFMVKSCGELSCQLPVRIWSSEEFRLSEIGRRNFVDLAVGCALALMFYNIFLFVSLRNPIHLIYSCYVLSNISYQALDNGFLSEYLYTLLGIGSLPRWSVHVGADITIILAYLFAMMFLGIRPKTRIGKIYLTCIFVGFCNICLAIFYSPATAAFICVVDASMALTLFVYSGFSKFGSSNAQVRIYILAWSFYLFGATGPVFNNMGFLERNDFTKYGLLVGGIFEMLLLSMALALRIKSMQVEIQDEQKEKLHGYKQLEKVFYPHQLQMIKQGHPIEKTMPTHSSEACVISLDIVNSSKLQHVKTKEFFHRVFSRCYDVMMSGYEIDSLKARAYRIKEMGDGFLCSVGYPFASLNSNICIDAVQLALDFHNIFCEEVEEFAYHEPIFCSIGIAIGSIAGFYPEYGTKEYDLYGTSIILATRYEGMRKSILNENLKSNIIILQERVAISLLPEQRAKFTPFNLVQNQIVVRDDPSARMLYYWLMPGGIAGLKVHQLKEAV